MYECKTCSNIDSCITCPDEIEFFRKFELINDVGRCICIDGYEDIN